MSLIDVKNLSVYFKTDDGFSTAVNDVTWKLEKGEVLGIVGESGSGKSLSVLSILGLLPYPKAFHDKKSAIYYNNQNLLYNPNLRKIRGSKIGFIFQEPMSSLNPLHTIGKQIAENINQHQKISETATRKKVIELLKLTGISQAAKRLKAYPHELSGGQRQRVMIAMAIANHPEILIADEPTTALDVTIQAQIIELLMDLRKKFNMSIIFISHDLNLIKKIADRIIVMKDGKIIEEGRTEQIFASPQKNYTKDLINSFNTLNIVKNIPKKELLSVKNLTVKYPLSKNFWGKTKQTINALDNINLTIPEGITLGIVGESGSGKTTLGQAICNLIKSEGEIIFSNQNIKKIDKKSLKNLRSQIQIIFQDPYNSLNPRMTIAQIIGEGLEVHFPKLSTYSKTRKILQTSKDVGLNKNDLRKYPHEFSGGQRQRIAIARAIILNPRLLILDEPTSALDVTIQAQIIKLLQKLQKDKQLTYIFISHDMRAIKSMSDEIAVMKDGKIIEIGKAKSIFEHPQNPYTQNLINASF